MSILGDRVNAKLSLKKDKRLRNIDFINVYKEELNAFNLSVQCHSNGSQDCAN